MLGIAVDRSAGRSPLRLGARLAMVAVLAVLSFAPDTWWSPYYRVHLGDQAGPGSVDLRVNGLPHQEITPIDVLRSEQPFRYDAYDHDPDNALDDVLIVGSGSGNDVAIALSQRAGHVDAVEIDPVIQALGQERHPDRPYDDPRVDVHIEDGRAFLHDASRPLRPDPVRAAGLAHPDLGSGVAAPRELPVHRGGDARGARASAARRHARDVPLLHARR